MWHPEREEFVHVKHAIFDEITFLNTRPKLSFESVDSENTRKEADPYENILRSADNFPDNNESNDILNKIPDNNVSDDVNKVADNNKSDDMMYKVPDNDKSDDIRNRKRN